MTAQEARELTKISKKTIEQIDHSIKIMAASGYDNCTLDKREVNVEEAEPYYKELGFDIRVTNDHFIIKW